MRWTPGRQIDATPRATIASEALRKGAMATAWHAGPPRDPRAGFRQRGNRRKAGNLRGAASSSSWVPAGRIQSIGSIATCPSPTIVPLPTWTHVAAASSGHRSPGPRGRSIDPATP
jgi:hypothetical protein